MSEQVSRTIQVADDHQEIRDSLRDYLTHNGFQVITAENAAEVREQFDQHHIDLVVLDIMMPGEDGISLCRYLRETRQTPVVFLTAKNEETDRIVGLEVGADDYVVKPFNPRELLARIKAVLRRIHAPAPAPQPPANDAGSIHFAQWRLHRRKKRLVSTCGEILHELTVAEYELLMAFLRNPGRVMTRDELLELTRGHRGGPFDRTIDNQVRRLRKKVEPEPSRPRVIRTVWGRGYCLDAEVHRPEG